VGVRQRFKEFLRKIQNKICCCCCKEDRGLPRTNSAGAVEIAKVKKDKDVGYEEVLDSILRMDERLNRLVRPEESDSDEG